MALLNMICLEICGIRENGLGKRLLQESALPLKRCVDMCRAAETTVAQTKVMNAKDEIHRVGIGGHRREQQKRATDPKKPVEQSNANSAVDNTTNTNTNALRIWQNVCQLR